MLTAPAFTVPAPTACLWCAANGCPACGQTGIGEAAFDFGATRTYRGGRSAEYAPTCGNGGRLTLTCKRTASAKPKVARYWVREFPNQCRGRTFYVAKVGANRRHEVFLGFDGSASCTCEAGIYEPTGKANQRARERGDAMYDGLGCAHADCLRVLLRGGFFDLPSVRHG